jgi:nitrate reductase cytochrome c-type subunit
MESIMKKTIVALSLLAVVLPFTLSSAANRKEAGKPGHVTPAPQVIQAETSKPAPAEEVKPLRKNPIAGAEDAPVDGTWKPTDTVIPRTFIHQPPVIPHDITGFIITTLQNDCLLCHGIEGSGAPRPFRTHYLDRDGKTAHYLDRDKMPIERIAARWNNCTQCHVGQADAPPLVDNIFTGKK